MLRDNKYRDYDNHRDSDNLESKKDLHRDEGRTRFPGGEWGRASEFGRNSEFHDGQRDESFYGRRKDRRERPFDMDNYDSGRQFSVDGADFDQDLDDDKWNSSRFQGPSESHRSRFSEPYSGGQFPRSQYGTGSDYARHRWSSSSRSYGTQDVRNGFSGKGPKGYKRSDERIREEVCEALYRSPFVDASDVEVTVKEGCVFLRGTVDSRNAKREAETSVENLTGVEDVHNELRLKRTMEGNMTGKSDNVNQGTTPTARNH